MRIITQNQLLNDERKVKERLEALRRSGNPEAVCKAEALLLRVQQAKGNITADSFRDIKRLLAERHTVHRIVKAGM